MNVDTPLEWRSGSCHCRAIQFEVLIPRTVDVYRCNCSICFMKQVSLRCSPRCLALSAHPAARAADFVCIPHGVCELQNHHFVVGADKMRRISGEDGALVDGADSVRTYRFGTGVAEHNFCAHCGICPYYTPRSNPDGTETHDTHARTQECMHAHAHTLTHTHTLSLAHTRTNAGFGITIYCMHDFQPSTPEQKRLLVVWKDFDGQNWEQNILTSDIRDKTAAGGDGTA